MDGAIKGNIENTSGQIKVFHQIKNKSRNSQFIGIFCMLVELDHG